MTIEIRDYTRDSGKKITYYREALYWAYFLMDLRNEWRKRKDYKKADEIREYARQELGFRFIDVGLVGKETVLRAEDSMWNSSTLQDSDIITWEKAYLKLCFTKYRISSK